MNTEIRILHLEDDPADADLIHARLMSAGVTCEIERVDTRSDFEDALRRRHWDIIFADYQLPSYDGIQALQFTRCNNPDIPFIVISGTLGEDAAIECLTSGATDYVTKQKLGRLVPVLRRAMDEAENREIRRNAESELHKLSHVVEQSPVSVIVTNTKGSIEYVNPKFTDVTGYSREEVIGRNPRILKSGLMNLEVYSDLWQALSSGKDWRGELCNRRKDGTIYWELAIISPMVDPEGRTINYIAVKEDITARKQMEDQIRASLHEKEVLLKEIHHRVKNNLQIISSLLGLQSRNYPEPAVREAFAESQRRVRAMALVHEHLYWSESLASIDFGRHLVEITHELQGACGRVGIAVTTDVERIDMSVDIAVPCGLIANELLTNSFKHAFPGEMIGTITAQLKRIDPARVVLLVADTGVGYTLNVTANDDANFGIGLVRTLVDQLGATIAVESARGTRTTITLPLSQTPP